MNQYLSTPDRHKVKSAAKVLRALNHDLRQEILKLISDQPGINVTDIHVSLKLEQSVASQHLSALRKAKLVTTKREGKFIHYFVDEQRIREILTFCETKII